MPPEWECLRGVAAFSVVIRFASASIIRCRSASLVVVQHNFRLPEHSSMRRAPAMPHSARSLPPRGRHSRLTVVRRGCKRSRLAGIHGEAMYTAPDCAARAVIQAANPQCAGSRGRAPCVLLGVQGGHSLTGENGPLIRAAPSALPLPPAPCAGNSLTRWANQKSATFFEKPT